MTPQRFSVQPGVPAWSLLFIVLAALCGGLWAATSQIEWLLAALLPVALALVTWRGGRACEIEIHETAIEISDPPQSILLEEIETLQVGNASYPVTATIPQRPLQFFANDRWVRLTGKIAPSMNLLYRTLLEGIPLGGSRDVPRKLTSFLDEQIQVFGEERVWSFSGRKRRRQRSMRLALAGLAIIVVGVVWLVHQVQNHRDATPLGVLGGCMIFTGFFMLLIALAIDNRTSARIIKKPEDCGVVISPKALAMTQGPLSGTLRWDEIRDISFGKSKHRAPPGAMVLHLDGALLTVFDIYDRPLPQIHALVMQNWDHAE